MISFFVIATQNPVESRGTYPLPEAQMDRFALKLSMGYVGPKDEVAILTNQEKIRAGCQPFSLYIKNQIS